MSGLFVPNALYTIHRGVDCRTLSPRIWTRVAEKMCGPSGNAGYFLYDDFRNFSATTAVATNVGRYNSDGNQWYTFEDTGNAVTQIATNKNGVVTLTTDADDNSEVGMVSCGNTGVLGEISTSTSFLAMEWRFSVAQIVTQNLVLGMGEEGLCVTDGIIDDSGDHTSKDLIGFSVNEDAASTLVFGYRKAGQTEQFPITSLKTLVASTFYNVGLVYDTSAPPSKRLAVYLDNAEQATYVDADDIAAATFPLGEELALYAAVKNVTDITAMSLDSVAFYQAE
jgi:hypothetical protein